MAVNDRIIIGNGYSWKEDGTSVMTYVPKLDDSGQEIITPDGGYVVIAAGGVKIGSYGVIKGPAINVHRSYLHDGQARVAGLGGKDFVQLIPIYIEKYQKVGFFPVDHIRFFGSYTV